MTTPEGVPADDKSISDLFDEIMGELRLLSALYMKTHPPEVTLQPTVIVSEAFIRLANHKPEDFKDEDDFRATASVILRQVFAERAKKRMEEKKRMAEQAEARKREAAAAASAPKSTPGKDSDLAEFQGASPELTLALETALEALSERDDRAARVAELRIFGSLPMTAVA
ncbi:MAG: ECF-type sigma factor, partial [Phycisphaerales bacterium]